jgi:hypothetical protein
LLSSLPLVLLLCSLSLLSSLSSLLSLSSPPYPHVRTGAPPLFAQRARFACL